MSLEEVWSDVRSAADSSRLARFLTEGGRVDLVSGVHGGTLAHVVTGSGRLDLLEELARRGARLDARDRYGWTPLRVALHADLAGLESRREGPLELARVRALLRYGADPNVPDDHGKTIWNVALGYGPMHMAALHAAIASVDASVGKRLKYVLKDGEDEHRGDCGQAFWISLPDEAEECFGVTAHSLSDAVRIIRSFRYSLPDDEAELRVRTGVSPVDIEPAIRARIGPLDVRGLWYPFIWHGLPPWLRG